MNRKQELLEEIGKAIRAVLVRYRLTDIAKRNHTRYLENVITADIQTELNKFCYQRSIQNFQIELIPVAVPREAMPSQEERIARIFMDLNPYPSAYACRLLVSLPREAEFHSILVTSEAEKMTIQPS
jgi:hypothetical protein